MYRILALAMLFAGPAFADAPPATPAAPTVAVPDFDQLMREALRLSVTGDRAQAVERLRQAATAQPKATQPHEQMCQLLYRDGHLAQALDACKGWLAREKKAVRHGQIKGLIAVLEKRITTKK